MRDEKPPTGPLKKDRGWKAAPSGRFADLLRWLWAPELPVDFPGAAKGPLKHSG